MRTKIELKNVRKGFGTNGGQLRVVEDVSFSVGEGEFVAIVGPSGCGKSTLMSIVAGFIRADSGSVAGITTCRNSTERDTPKFAAARR